MRCSQDGRCSIDEIALVYSTKARRREVDGPAAANLYCFPSSCDRRVAASTAAIRAARRPRSSRAARPAIVVPPGLATLSLRAAGCSPWRAPSRLLPHGLRRQDGGHVPRQAHPHAAVAEGLDHHIDKRRPGAGQTRHRVEQLFIDLQRPADSAQQVAHEFAIGCRRAGAERIRRSARADQRRRIGHHAHHAVGLQPFAQPGQRDAGRDRNDQLVSADFARQLAEHRRSCSAA